MHAMRSLIEPSRLRAVLGAAALAAALGSAPLARAAILQVSPVRVQFEPTQQGETIQLVNNGQDAVQAQVRIMRWTQQDGHDRLVPATSDEIVASPPIMRIEPGQRQTVRLTRLQPTAPSSVQSYRLLIDELPPPAWAGSGVRVLMRQSIPVFVAATPTPPPARRRAETDLSGVRAQVVAGQNGRADLRVSNDGAQPIRISALSTVAPGGQAQSVNSGLIGYVLPGQNMSWPVNVAYPLPAGVTLKARFDDDAEAQTVPLGGAGR